MPRFIVTAGYYTEPGTFSRRSLTHLTMHDTIENALYWLGEVQHLGVDVASLTPLGQHPIEMVLPIHSHSASS